MFLVVTCTTLLVQPCKFTSDEGKEKLKSHHYCAREIKGADKKVLRTACLRRKHLCLHLTMSQRRGLSCHKNHPHQ